MTDIEAIAKCKKELDMALYQSETSNYPGIQAIHRIKAEWLSRVLYLAQKAINDAEKPKTNADRIRAMGDEELVDFLGEYRFCDICDEGCEACAYHGDCNKRLLDWLKRPTKGDKR